MYSLPKIGAHCAWVSCNVLDFLPIDCQCNKKFCSEHITPDRHDCPLLTVEHPKSTFSDKIRRCDVEGCDKPSLRMANGNEDGTCSSCHKSLCAHHRYPDLHGCPSATTERATETTTRKRTSPPTQLPSSVSQTRKPPRDPVKLAQWRKVEVMKMRHRAMPGDPKDRDASISPDQRTHIRVLKDGTEKIFWFRKNMIAGRALDLLVHNLKLAFPEDLPLQLSQVPSDGSKAGTLRNDQPLSEQVEDGCLLAIHPRLEENS